MSKDKEGMGRAKSSDQIHLNKRMGQGVRANDH